MRLLRMIIRISGALFLVAFGTLAIFAPPGDWKRFSYPVVSQGLDAEPANLTNSARAPPTASAAVVMAGCMAMAQTADLRALDCVGTTGSVYAHLHGAVGCSAAEALDGNCASGAAAGIAQSIFAGLQEGEPKQQPGQSDEDYAAVYAAWKNDVAGQANLLGAVVGYTTSRGQAVNVSNAASIAESGARYNYLGHTDLAVLADRLAECRADGACTEEELLDIRDEMLARSLANDEALASCLTQACVEEHLAAVAGLEAFREAIGTDLAARQIIGHALQRNAGVDVGLLAILGARGGTSGPTFGPQDWALARAALNVANAETILQQCGQDAACMIAVANEIQAGEAFVDLLRDLPGVGGVIAANDCVMTGDAMTCAAVSVEALGAAGDMLQNGRRVLLRMGEDTVPATVRTTDEGVEVVTDAGDVVRVADAPNGGPRITIRDHYEHHDAMRNDVIGQLEGQGYRVADGEASFGNACGTGRCCPDILYEAPDGTVGIIEIKTGNADLSIRQTEIFPQIENGDAIPRGAVADRFGLDPGVPLRDQGYPNGIPIEVREFPGAGQ